MPIANCFIKNKKITQKEVQALASQWAKAAHVDVKDVCLTVVSDFIQGGHQYEIMVNLFLPSLWNREDVKRIQHSLMKLLSEYLKIGTSEIFIITSILESGHVVENGEMVEWD